MQYPYQRSNQPPSSSSSYQPRSSNITPQSQHRSANIVTQQSQTKSVLWGSRSVDIFDKVEQIGEGTYGKVYLAKNRETGDSVALKKIRMDNEKEGFPITAIREIKILKELRHENIIQLKEIVTSKATKENKESSIYMVFEYMDHDLTGLMMNDGSWCPTTAQIKCYMKQLLQGLHYCHTNGVLHRDIKGSNLLLNNRGMLKLADFGLARPFTEQQGNYTNRVITLWYRPPELLLGAVQYGPAIDMWSVGCILAELLAKRAIFPGRNEIDQLELIFKLCGTPDEENWADCSKLPWYKMFKPQKLFKRAIRDTFKSFPPEALDLVDRLLTLDPKKRITAAEALDHDYFWTPPLPCDPSAVPVYPSSHEFQAKKRRQQQQVNDAIKRQKGPQGLPLHPPSTSGSALATSSSSSSQYPPHMQQQQPLQTYLPQSQPPNQAKGLSPPGSKNTATAYPPAKYPPNSHGTNAPYSHQSGNTSRGPHSQYPSMGNRAQPPHHQYQYQYQYQYQHQQQQQHSHQPPGGPAGSSHYGKGQPNRSNYSQPPQSQTGQKPSYH